MKNIVAVLFAAGHHLPVCLAAFTAAAIARISPMATGLYSWKLAKGLYIVPILFAYTPFLGGSWADDFTIFFFAFIGLYAFAGGFQGYLESRLNPFLRIFSLVVADKTRLCGYPDYLPLLISDHVCS